MNDTRAGFWPQLRAAFLRGAAVIIPIGLTYWFFRALLNAIDGILSPVLERWIGRPVPGLGFISMLVIILLVGFLSRNIAGRILFAWFETLLRSVPFVRSVYGAIKDLVGAFSPGGKGKTFREVVLIEYPRKNLYSMAFVTNEMTYTRADGTMLHLVNVYIPSPPNPTSGVLILVPREEVHPLTIGVEQGLKLVLSGGIVVPCGITERPEARP
ncbi:MAG: DUF502 domain-containing protein [Bacteroidota bacterium]